MKYYHYLITGANSDLGKTIVKELACNDKNKIIAVSRSKILNKVNNVIYIDNLDLSNETDLSKLSSFIEQEFNNWFVFIHSVGNFWYHKPMEKTEFEEAADMMSSHYNTLYGVVKFLLPVFKKVNGGKIIAFSCNSVGFNYPEMAAFTSAKAAVETLIKCVANEYSKDGIIANAVALSTIRTEKVINSKINKYHEFYISEEELMEVIENLINASPLINGNVIKVLKYSKYFYNEGYFQRNTSTYLD